MLLLMKQEQHPAFTNPTPAFLKLSFS